MEAEDTKLKAGRAQTTVLDGNGLGLGNVQSRQPGSGQKRGNVGQRRVQKKIQGTERQRWGTVLRFPLLHNEGFGREGFLIEVPQTCTIHQVDTRGSSRETEKSGERRERAKTREGKQRGTGERLGGFSEFLRLFPHLRVQRSANAPRPSASDTEGPSSTLVSGTRGTELEHSHARGGRGKGASGVQRAGEQTRGCAPVDVAPSWGWQGALAS